MTSGSTTNPAALFSLAVAAFQQGDLPRARTMCDGVLKLAPQQPDALHLRALLHHAAGDLKRAAADCERALAGRSNFAPACFTLGSIRQQQGQHAQAASAFRRAVELDPASGPAWACLGIAARALGRADEAVAAYDRAAALMPNDANVPFNRGNALIDLGRVADAIESWRRTVALAPNHREGWRVLAETFERTAQHDAALAALAQRQALEPDDPAIDAAIGRVHIDLEQHDAAVAALTRAATRAPDDPEPHGWLAFVALFGLGDVAAARAHIARANALAPSAFRSSFALFARHYQSDTTPESLFADHLAWRERFETPVAPLPAAPRATDPERQLRVGFVSADLYGHPVGRFLLPVLEHLDRTRFAIACYPTNPRADGITAALRAGSDHWRLLSVDAARAAQLIRADGIDILVDLGGHTSGDVLEIFVHQPAPIQVTWLGYPNTTGMTRIGWRLTDAIADPPGEADRLSSERLVRLPNGFHCYVAPVDVPPPNALPAGRDGAITFGSLNALAKLSDATVAAWARVLDATPTARLLIRRSGLAAASARDTLTRRFAACGIDAGRLVLVGAGAGGSFTAYGAIDIALDCFPYNGTTTTCDSLWMGVPVVTWRGDRHGARVGASLLHRLGLDDWVGGSVDEFVAIATRLAADRAALAAWRAGLRDRMAASPLCDGPGFGRAVGAALRQMWVEHCGAAQP